MRRSNLFKEAARIEKGEPVVIHLTHHNMGGLSVSTILRLSLDGDPI